MEDLEGTGRTFPVNLLQDRRQTLKTYSQPDSEEGSSLWTPKLTFPGEDARIKRKTVVSSVDPVLKKSRFSKLMELLSRHNTIQETLTKGFNAAKHKNYSLKSDKSDNPNSESASELPFLSDKPETSGGELARQRRKGAGEEPGQKKGAQEESKQRKGASWEEFKKKKGALERSGESIGAEEPKKRRSAAPPEEEVFNEIASYQNNNNEILVHESNPTFYNVNHRNLVEYVNAKRNQLADEKSENEMRGSNSLLRMSHLRPPPRDKKQVENQICMISESFLRKASIRCGSHMETVHQSSTSTPLKGPNITFLWVCIGKVMGVWRFPSLWMLAFPFRIIRKASATSSKTTLHPSAQGCHMLGEEKATRRIIIPEMDRRKPRGRLLLKHYLTWLFWASWMKPNSLPLRPQTGAIYHRLRQSTTAPKSYIHLPKKKQANIQ